jgi:hypothetical protein
VKAHKVVRLRGSHILPRQSAYRWRLGCDPYAASDPCNKPWRPIELWDIEAPTFCLDNRLTDGGKVVSLTHRRPYTPHLRKVPGTHFCYRLRRPQCHGAAGKIRSIEKKSPHRDSNSRPSDLWHSASSNYATAYPSLLYVHKIMLGLLLRFVLFVLKLAVAVQFVLISNQHHNYRHVLNDRLDKHKTDRSTMLPWGITWFAQPT